MLKKLLLLSFIEGAAVMAAELCGAKLLAPIFGSSLYVWASVMGITLLALAVGYFYGGFISMTTKVANKLFLLLSFAALYVILMPVISFYVIPRISYLPFLPAIVISTSILLLPPIFFLGATSPLFIVLQTTNNDGGRVSGMVYAISTLGGIFATFLCGFYLIPKIGLSASLLWFGGVLFAVNGVVFKAYKSSLLFLFAGFIYLNLQISKPEVKPIFVSDGVLGRLEVINLDQGPNSAVRVLKINNIIQTEMDLGSRLSISDYVSLLDTLIPSAKTDKSSLVLGLGGGLTANLLINKNYSCKGVEFDDRIISSARNFFYLNPKVITTHADARYFLNHSNEKFDVVLVDVFKAEEQPSHVLTIESLTKLKKQLKDSALLLINWHGYVSGRNGMGTSIVLNTLQKAGFNVTVCSKGADENYRNVIFVAAIKSLKKQPYELLSEDIAVSEFINTDDLPLLEKYNAEANKAWRTNYLRYYQSEKNNF